MVNCRRLYHNCYIILYIYIYTVYLYISLYLPITKAIYNIDIAWSISKATNCYIYIDYIPVVYLYIERASPGYLILA